METLNAEYIKVVEIKPSDVDKNREIRMSAILRIMQDVAEEHLVSNAIPYELLYSLGIIFVLTDIRVTIYRTPKMTENLIVKTYQRMMKGAKFFRDFDFYIGEDLVMQATSISVSINPETRSIQRTDKLSNIAVPYMQDRTPLNPQPKKITIPKRMEIQGERKIYYSDLDYNGHMNNTVYADIVMDHMPNEIKDYKVTDLSIRFQHECYEGESLIIMAGQQEDDSYVFVGEKADKRSFVVKIYVR